MAPGIKPGFSVLAWKIEYDQAWLPSHLIPFILLAPHAPAPHPSFWAGCYCCSCLVHHSQSLASFSLNLGVFDSFSLFMTLLRYHRNQKVFPDLMLTATNFIPSSIFLLGLIIWNEQVHLFIYLLIPYIVSLKVKYGQNWMKCIGLLFIIVCVYCICILCITMDSLLIIRIWICNCCCCVGA